MTASTLQADERTATTPPDPKIPEHPVAIPLYEICLREVNRLRWQALRAQCDTALSDPSLDDDIRALLLHNVEGKPSDITRRTGLAHWLLRNRLVEWDRKQAARQQRSAVLERLRAERDGSSTEAALAPANGGGTTNGSALQGVITQEQLLLQLQGVLDVRSWAMRLRSERTELIASLEPVGLTFDTLPSGFLDEWGVLLRRRIPSNSFRAVEPHYRAIGALRRLLHEYRQALRRQSVRDSAPAARPRKHKAAVPESGEALAAEIRRAVADMDPPLSRTKQDLLKPILLVLQRPEYWKRLLQQYGDKLTAEWLLNAGTVELKELKRMLRSQFGS